MNIFVNFHPLVLSLLSSFLLYLAWPVKPTGIFLFVALFPLLVLWDKLNEKEVKKPGLKLFGYTYLTFLLWNAATTWWIWYASPGGALGAIFANSALMTLPWVLAHYVRRNTTQQTGFIALITFWLLFEWFHFRWDLTWTWLTLGNGFATLHQWVQWYEYTGVLGGTLWIWLVNIQVYLTLKHASSISKLILAGLIVVPISFSYLLYFTYEEKGTPIQVALVQPNIDPYSEKFADSPSFIGYKAQLQRFKELSLLASDSTTDVVLWPETALSEGYWEESLPSYEVIKDLMQFSKKENLPVITGATTFAKYGKQKKSSTARFRDNIGYYDVFNTAIFTKPDGKAIQLYHKSKLTPGVERLPFPEVLGPLTEFAIDLGGSSGSLGIQEDRTVFYIQDSIGIAPVICYESIFGDFVGDYVMNGAHIIGIITNDGWWRDTPGHKQHAAYAKLRAIEHRRAVARSANTGKSCFINQRGDLRLGTDWWVQTSLQDTVLANKETTLYSTFGDYIGRLALFIGPFLLLSVWVKNRSRFRPSKTKRNQVTHSN